MQLLKRLSTFLPLLAGLLVLGWGLLGLFGPDGRSANAATPEDPSLNDGGFRLTAPAKTPIFERAWVKVDPTALIATPTVTLAPSATPTAVVRRGVQIRGVQIIEPTDAPAIPDRIVIPAIELDARVVVAPTRTLTLQQQVFEQWLAPDSFAVGWHTGSAFLGKPGNTVLNGHHNVFGKVFGRLVELEAGDEIILYAGFREFRYMVAQSMILKELGATLDEREANAQWILPSPDERLTLVTCWPAESNSHRLLLVASPVD